MNKRICKKRNKQRIKLSTQTCYPLPDITIETMIRFQHLKIFSEYVSRSFDGPYHRRNLRRAFKSFEKRFIREKISTYKFYPYSFIIKEPDGGIQAVPKIPISIREPIPDNVTFSVLKRRSNNEYKNY